ncbi:autotransporter domain-containing protein [Stenotrophomonas maltophilia]|uniref:autotransporter domain-containing protein n=1 Tax=Stenotrophomonas maltophilia TaxID=40324 RepID=UPI0039F6691E
MNRSTDRAGHHLPGRKARIPTMAALQLLLLWLGIIGPAAAQTVPGPPTIGPAITTPSSPGMQTGSATVSFSPPSSDGGAAISDYTIISSPGGQSVSASSSPAVVTGLTLGTSYTFGVIATNSAGSSPPSAQSNAVTPMGQQTISFVNPGGLNFGTTTPLSATSSSGLAVQLVAQTTNICDIINTNQVRAKAPGTCTVTASQPGSSAYLPATSVSQSFQILIPGAAVNILTTSLPPPIRGTPYSQTVVASSGAPPYTFSIVSGPLPNGLVLNPASGTITGVATGSGPYVFTVEVTDQALQTARQTYAGVVVSPAFTISPPTLPAGTVGMPFIATTFSTSGGIAPYTYAITSGSLPAGLGLSASGTISGIPTAAGTYAVTITATDNFGSSTSQPRVVTITDAQPVAVDDVAAVAANGHVRAAVTANDSGMITSISVVGGPAHGTAVVEGLHIIYTPAANYFGSDSLQYTAAGPGGVSAPATLAISITAGPVPVATPREVTLLAGASLRLDATEGASNGPFTAVAISMPPASGQAVVQGNELVYTAAQQTRGQVSFDYTLSNAFGLSQPARVTLTVNPAPTVVPITAEAVAGHSVQINLSRTAHGGPFTAATLVAVMPAAAGTATINPGADGYVLDFTPASSFSGTAQIAYTLSNTYATSAQGVVTITVAPRSDPSADAEVRGLLSAHADAARRMAMGQINNFQRRLEQLHSGNVTGFSNGITLASAGATRQRDGRDTGPDPQQMSRRYLLQADAASADTAQAAGLQPGGLAGDWSLWTGGALNFGSARGGGRDSGTDFTTSGISLGADRAINGKLAVGGGIGYGRDRSDIGDNGSRSSVDSYSMAVYASYRPSERLYVDALLGHQRLDLDARRHATDSGNTLHGQRDGRQWFASLSSGYRFVGRTLEFTPYGRLDMARARLDGFTEQGDVLDALAYQSQTVNLSTATVGALARWAFKRDGALWSPQLRAEFGRDLQGSSEARLGYADLPGAPLYRTTLYGQSRSHGLLGAGISLQTDSAWLLRAEYQTRLDSSSGNDQSVMLGVEKVFGR